MTGSKAKISTKTVIFCGLFAALTAIGAFIRIPLPFATITLQLLFTALAGVLLGSFWGAASQLVYLLLGLCGLPIFASGGGIGYVLHPTFGFILGLVPCAALIGWLSRRWRYSFLGIIGACGIGILSLYAIGTPYLHLILTNVMGLEQNVWDTVVAGMLIYLPGDAVKLIAVALLGKTLVPRLRGMGVLDR